ncbi:MAG: type I CRISPR-associated protein Cas7, partial [Candidatus Aminicenantaceae bacterium]
IKDRIKGEKVLFWKTFNEEGKVGNLIEMLHKNGLCKLKGEKIDEKSIKAGEILGECIDVRLFGGTFTVTGNNFSVTGPVQISYGLDIYGKGNAVSSQLGTPKAVLKKSGEEAKIDYSREATTLGNEVRLTEAHYAYDFTINPNNLRQDSYLQEVAKEHSKISFADIDMFKEALRFAPGYLISTTKAGAFTECCIYAEFEMEDGKVPLIPILKNMVKIEENGDKRKLSISDAIKALKERGAKKIEVYYEPGCLEIEPVDGADFLHIYTGKKI